MERVRWAGQIDHLLTLFFVLFLGVAHAAAAAVVAYNFHIAALMMMTIVIVCFLLLGLFTCGLPLSLPSCKWSFFFHLKKEKRMSSSLGRHWWLPLLPTTTHMNDNTHIKRALSLSLSLSTLFLAVSTSSSSSRPHSVSRWEEERRECVIIFS